MPPETRHWSCYHWRFLTQLEHRHCSTEISSPTDTGYPTVTLRVAQNQGLHSLVDALVEEFFACDNRFGASQKVHFIP